MNVSNKCPGINGMVVQLWTLLRLGTILLFWNSSQILVSFPNIGMEEVPAGSR